MRLKVTAIFNLYGLKETDWRTYYKEKKRRTYYANDPDVKNMPFKIDHKSWWKPILTNEELSNANSPIYHKRDKEGFAMPDTEYGFVLSPRVSPRRFEGLVLQCDSEIIQQMVSQLSKIIMEVNQDKQERLLPIFGRDGNLLWPKQMSYEEVKKFVEERDKKSK